MARTRKDSIPYYEQVANILRATIISSDQGQPFRLPTEDALCGTHKVSRITIRRAMDLLVRDGLIERVPRRGTFSIPKAVAQWKLSRQERVVHVLTGPEQLASVPHSFYGLIYQGILHRCEDLGYHVITQQLSAYRLNADMGLSLPDKETTLGVIFIGFMNEAMVSLYADAGYPVVCMDYWTTNQKADAIVVDCYGEGQTAVDFLLRQGHTHLFYLGNMVGLRQGLLQRESDAELVLAGMQRSLLLAGLPSMPPERIRFAGYRLDEDIEDVEWYLSLRPRPTAGFVFAARLCSQLIRHLRKQGIRCPEDVSLITKYSEEDDPLGAARMRCPAMTMGEMAVDALLDRTAGRRSAAVRFAVTSTLVRGRTVRQLI